MVGVFFLLWTALGLVVGLTNMSRDNYWWLEVLFSVFAIGVAVYLLRRPEIGVALVFTLLGTVLVVRGVFDMLLSAVQQRDSTNVRWLRAITGVTGIVAGVLVFVQPVESGIAVA